jgi:hypothetical protein
MSLPLHIIDKVVYLASKGACRDYSKNKLVCKEINATTPYEFEFACNDDVDDFFDYSVHTQFPTYTLGQLKNPKTETEIAFSKQFLTFYDTQLEKNVEFLRTDFEDLPSAVDRAKWSTLWVYKMMIRKLVHDSIDVFYDDWNISEHFSDSDSLCSVKKKLLSYISAHKLETYTHLSRDNLSITSLERYNLCTYRLV